MGRLIVSAQMTMDCVMDQLEGWFDPEGEAGVHGLDWRWFSCSEGRTTGASRRCCVPGFVRGDCTSVRARSGVNAILAVSMGWVFWCPMQR